MTRTELMVTTLRLEGDRWRLYKKLDKCWRIDQYARLKTELSELNLLIETNIELIRSMGGKYV